MKFHVVLTFVKYKFKFQFMWNLVLQYLYYTISLLLNYHPAIKRVSVKGWNSLFTLDRHSMDS